MKDIKLSIITVLFKLLTIEMITTFHITSRMERYQNNNVINIMKGLYQTNRNTSS